ncbi:flap endonuclease-1, partial [Candidatus Woesearchaeota archaeon]|nr:flap endonuclease-1 [Candidatus Woesearchaeota archaeon]
MGVAITELLEKKGITLNDLKGKILAVDSPLWLYQFLSSIRQPDGALFTDSKGNVTSHLMGLFFRTVKLMESGIRLVFCFDGKVPELKKEERQRRRELKQEAEMKLADAEKRGDIEGMKKFAARTSRLTSEMIADAKKLLEALGLPYIIGASEAEAQASFLVTRGDAYAVSTNDADALLFNAPRIVRNLNIAGKKKKTKTLGVVAVEPELIDLKENLRHLGITHDQLIALCMLVGTDYSPGVKGIGPKTALKM